jgi:hypothetical protein
MVDNDTAYHRWPQALSDDEWCEFLAGTPMLGRAPPPLTPEEFQRAWVGNSGEDAFREAIAFCGLLKSTLSATDCWLGPDSRLLDPVPQRVERCRSALPGGQFEVSPLPPYRFSDSEFDVAYLYSVFSHLNEAPFLAVPRAAAARGIESIGRESAVCFSALGSGAADVARQDRDQARWIRSGSRESRLG